MNRTSLLIVSVVSLLTVGCVSTGKYKKLQSDNDVLKSQLDMVQREKDQLAVEKSTLEVANKETQSQYQDLVGQLSKEVQDGELKITQYKNMLSVDVAEQIFFTSGSAKLKKTGQEVLKKVGKALAQYKDKVIRVVGHTDNVPLGKVGQNIFPNNWELSVIRATNVVRFLQEQAEFDPNNLIASGRGEFSPIAPNDTPEGRQKNRRIEIMLIDKQVVDALEKK